MKTTIKYDNIDFDFSHVSSSKLYMPNSKVYHPNGLMSEQIFGPVRDYTCQCGIVKQTGERCPTCGVKYIKSEARDTTESIIKLPFRIIAPQLFYLALKIDKSLQKEVDTYKLEMQKLYDLIDAVKAGTYEGNQNSSYHQMKAMLEKYPEFADIREILVIAPNLRPSTGGAKKYISDEINHAYQSIIEKIESYNESPVKNDYHILVVMKTYYEKIYLHEIINKISTKQGYIRQNMLGKRVDFSGRTVIIPETKLPMSVISVPYRILINLFEPYIYHKYSNIIRAIDDLTVARQTGHINDRLRKIIDTICFEDKIPVMINRQPTLHRQSMRAFIPIPTDKLTVGVNPYIVDGFNADFDGDQMAIHVPLLDEELFDFTEKFINHRNQIQPGVLQFSSVSQFSYSVYIMTKDEPNENNIVHEISNEIKLEDLNKIFKDNLFEYSDTVKVILQDGNAFITTFGRLFITLYTGTLVSQPLNKSKFNKIVTNKLLKILENRNLEYSDLKFADDLLHDHLLNVPISISIRSLVDIYNNNQFTELLNKLRNTKSMKDLKVYEKQLEDLLQTAPELENIRTILKSGAKGGFSSLKQLLVSKGFVVDALGNKVQYYINSSFIDGLNYHDMYAMSFGTRKGSLDRSVSTATTGYFMRKLVFAIQDATVDYSVDDCGAEAINEVDLNESNYEAYLMKYFIDPETNELTQLSVSNYKNYLDKTLMFRSQIACKCETGYCKKCYGNYQYVYTHSKNVGVIAAQACGERVTQLTMRTFHTGGVVSDVRDEINHEYFSEITDDFIVQKEFTINSIDYDEYVVDEDLDQDLYITTVDDVELLIPKGSILHVKLHPEQRITKGTKLFSIPKSQSNSVTNIFDAILAELEHPDKSNKTWKELLDFLMDTFYYTEGIISTHLETIVAQMMREPETLKPARLNSLDEYILLSIKKLPLLRTILTFGYQNFHANLLKSLVDANNDYDLSILEKIIVGVTKSNLGLDETYGSEFNSEENNI